MNDNIDILVRLRMAARDALAKCEGYPSPSQALKFFEPMVLEDAELCQAILRKASDDLRDKVLMEELRHVFIGDKNREAEVAPDRIRPAPTKHSNVVTPYTGGPSASQLAAERASHKAAVAAIYSAQETMISGRFFHSFSHGEATSMLPIKLKRIERLGADIAKLTDEQRRERFEVRLLELVIGHAKVVDQTVPLTDVVSAKQLAKYVAQVQAEFAVEVGDA